MDRIYYVLKYTRLSEHPVELVEEILRDTKLKGKELADHIFCKIFQIDWMGITLSLLLNQKQFNMLQVNVMYAFIQKEDQSNYLQTLTMNA